MNRINQGIFNNYIQSFAEQVLFIIIIMIIMIIIDIERWISLTIMKVKLI